MTEPLYLLTLLVTAGVAAQLAANILRLPSILVLLAVGLILGPGTGVLDPQAMFGELLRPIIGLAVAVVLFEGGLSLNLHEARVAGRPLLRLIVSGLFVGSALTAVAGVGLAGLSVATAAVIGGILVVTGPTVIIPMLRGARIAMRPATLLKWEGIVNDPFGALLAYLVFKVAELSGSEIGMFGMVLSVLGMSAASAVLGALVGLLFDKALDRGLIKEHLKSPGLLAAVLLVYAAAEAMGKENGLMAVTAMGLVLANVKNAHVEDIRHFKEQISTLLIGLLFIVLSAQLDVSSLQSLLGPPLLLVLAIVFVVRPLVVLLATAGSEISWPERLLIGWIAPRGVVAAAVAGAFAPLLIDAGYPDASMLVPVVFGVIVLTVSLHSLTIVPLSRHLGLSAADGNGILIVGAATWCVELARALDKAGAEVMVADARYRRVSHARREGIEVHFGDVLSEEMEIELPVERLTWVLAASDDDSYNALVCLRFTNLLGRNNVVQLTPDAGVRDRKQDEARAKGLIAWGERGSYRALSRSFWQGKVFKVTTLSDSFGWDALVARNPDALFLFQLAGKRLRPVDPEKPPAAGTKVVFLALPDNAASPDASSSAAPAGATADS